ncbi:ribonuclease HI family protein [Patescibacteria group bacterium]|nr:ribonuclease HI family protein [Patescibacteria group bacterium]
MKKINPSTSLRVNGEQSRTINIYTDGGSRGNPGHASYGFVVLDDNGKLIYEQGKYIGITTNNVAEYSGALEALKYVKKNLAKENLSIELFADSRLVIEQLSGRFKVKSAHLKPIIEKIKILALELGGVIYNYIPRHKNTEADRLVNLALDSR